MSSTTATPPKSSKPASNDSMTGTKAQKYINALYQALQAATSSYQSEKTILQKYVTQQKDYTAKYGIADTLYKRLNQNLKDAHNAKKDVKQVMNFFTQQQSSVLTMVDNAKDMSTSAYESLSFLVQQGIGRVEAINSTLNSDNANFEVKKTSDTPPPPNTPIPWASSVTDAASKAQASGTSAMKAGEEAVIAAFKAYISNQTIYSRTTSYLNSFTSFYTQLQTLQSRLVKETAQAKQQVNLIKAQLDATNSLVVKLSTNVDQKKISLDEAQNKYSAAQQGASYAGTSAAS